MYNLVSNLKYESSSNGKFELLKSYSNNENVKEALKFTYDPFVKFYIKKIEKRKVAQVGLITDFGVAFEQFKSIANSLSKRKITGNAAIALVHYFLDNCSDELRYVFSLILKKDLKVGISIKTLQKVFGKDFIEDFKVQLAKTYDKTKNYKVDFWQASPKIDGLRCYFTRGKLLTRKGREIVGFEHIIKELNIIVKEYKLDFIDGELFTNDVNFQEIQGAVMSNKNIDPERKSKIKYHIFLVGRKDFKRTSDMLKVKDIIFFKNKFEYLVEVPYYRVDNTPEMIEKFCEKFMADGYEGVMLRSPDVWYDFKRSNALLKFKLFKEADFKIVGFFEGEGKYEGTLGGIIIKGNYNAGKDRNYQIISRVGTGFSADLRNLIWNNKDEYLGKVVEIKFQNITDEADECGRFSLRFPVFLKTKEDR